MDTSKPAGLTFRAAGQRAGCTHRAIALAVRAGRIPLLSDGKVSASAVDSWNSTRRGKRGGTTRKQTDTKRAAVSSAEVFTSAALNSTGAINLAALAVTLSERGMFTDRAAAELARDSYQARLRQLEFEERSGRLVDVAKVQVAIATACGTVRTRLMAIPAERAAALTRIKRAPEMQAALHEIIVEALSELTITFGGETSAAA